MRNCCAILLKLKNKRMPLILSRAIIFMNCNLCKKEIELNQEATIRNDHVYHVCCAITYDKGETDDGYQNPCHTASCIPDDTFTISN